LPYPWALPDPQVPTTAQTSLDESVQPSKKGNEPNDDANEEGAQAEINTEVNTKDGIVKLLFTLKQGNFHGYIAPDDGTKDILFHEKYINADVFSQLERGTRVTAAIKHVEGKAYATRVEVL